MEAVRFKGQSVTIGTCEQLYYTTYGKFIAALTAGLLKIQPGNLSPEQYALPDSPFFFRFPFPDEDHLPIGGRGDFRYNRSLALHIQNESFLQENLGYHPKDRIVQVDLAFQQLKTIHGDPLLCPVLRVPHNGWRVTLDDQPSVQFLCDQITRFYVQAAYTPEEWDFWTAIVHRIQKGFPTLNPSPSHQIQSL